MVSILFRGFFPATLLPRRRMTKRLHLVFTRIANWRALSDRYPKAFIAPGRPNYGTCSMRHSSAKLDRHCAFGTNISAKFLPKNFWRRVPMNHAKSDIHGSRLAAGKQATGRAPHQVHTRHQRQQRRGHLAEYCEQDGEIKAGK